MEGQHIPNFHSPNVGQIERGKEWLPPLVELRYPSEDKACIPNFSWALFIFFILFILRPIKTKNDLRRAMTVDKKAKKSTETRLDKQGQQ